MDHRGFQEQEVVNNVKGRRKPRKIGYERQAKLAVNGRGERRQQLEQKHSQGRRVY